MKLTKESALFQVPFGSHLYGTSTPTSDLDAKVVALPGFEDLIMLKKIDNAVVKPDGYVEGEKMKAGEIEFEIVPLQIFLEHFYEGQTYALEIAFAVLNDMHVVLERAHGKLADGQDGEYLIEWMSTLVSNFLTSDIKKMVGYARSQSQLYGLKTERFNTLLSLISVIEGVDESKRLIEVPDLLSEILQYDYVKEVKIMNGQGGKLPVPGIEINGKQFVLNTKWEVILKSLNKTLAGYGSRVKDHTDQPTDWKALSHAIRIGEQILEVLDKGRISFPRPNAAYLLDVKKGNVPLEQATAYLTSLFNAVEDKVKASQLPAKTPELDEKFKEFKLDVLKHYYGLS